MHSFNALAAGDVYGKIYGTGYFYEQSAPQQAFDKRLQYILNHQHTTLGKPWKQLSDYIFGFEAENEAMIGKGEAYIQSHTAWYVLLPLGSDVCFGILKGVTGNATAPLLSRTPSGATAA